MCVPVWLGFARGDNFGGEILSASQFKNRFIFAVRMQWLLSGQGYANYKSSRGQQVPVLTYVPDKRAKRAVAAG